MIGAETIVEVEHIDCRLGRFVWPFAAVESDRIARNWAKSRAQKPALYDGRVLLGRCLDVCNDCLRGEAFEVSYSSFLAWRDWEFPDERVHNVFAMPALLTADGAFILGQMSTSTANGGRLYFPAGTPEPQDVGRNGSIDFEANILRELEEETGLGSADVALAPSWSIVFAGPLVACMRIARSPLTASELIRRIGDFIEGQQQPELDRVVAVRGEGDFDGERTPEFMLRYLRAALGTKPPASETG